MAYTMYVKHTAHVPYRIYSGKLSREKTVENALELRIVNIPYNRKYWRELNLVVSWRNFFGRFTKLKIHNILLIYSTPVCIRMCNRTKV